RGNLQMIFRIAMVFLFFIFAPASRAEEFSMQFNAANRLYEQGKITDAIGSYEKITQAGFVSAPLFFNLGNSFFKAGKIGQSIVAYRRAQNLAPRDPEIQENLRFARAQAGGGTAPGKPFWQTALGKLTLDEWTIWTAAFLAVLFFILAMGEGRSGWKKSLRPMRIFLGLGSLFLALCLIFSWRIQTVPSAVVVVPEAVVRLGPFEESQSAFTLRDGAEVVLLARQNGWREMVDATKRTGWLPEKQLALVASSPQK
ncbi:MAG: SH3 domain-containing protein, partial [Verrucomicrobiota bacterium]